MNIINALRRLEPGTPALDTALQEGLATLDSRSAAVFIKQLAHANMVGAGRAGGLLRAGVLWCVGGAAPLGARGLFNP